MSHEHAHPVSPGAGATGYVRYMRTDVLLSLQRSADEWVHPDELLFQATHQAHELFLKAASHSLARAVTQMDGHRPMAAQLLVDRATLTLRLLTDQLQLLRTISPADFHTIRTALGHGSGVESPGWQEFRLRARTANTAFLSLLDTAAIDLRQLYQATQPCHCIGLLRRWSA